jgi:hypothetical protein
MEIKLATDWTKVSIELERQLSDIGYNPDLKRMYNNINHMVAELSKLEVVARTKQKYSITREKVEAINKAINHLESYLLIAKLMK